MSKWLDKLGLSEELSLKYYVRPDDFVSLFQKNVDSGDGLFSGAFDALRFSKTDYRGTITATDFSIRKKKRFFDSISAIALITGQIVREKNGTRLLVTITSFTGIMKFVTWLLAIVYVVAAVFITFSGLIEKHGLIPYLFLILHALMLLLIFYFILRRSVSKVASNLDPDFKMMIRDLEELDPKQS